LSPAVHVGEKQPPRDHQQQEDRRQGDDQKQQHDRADRGDRSDDRRTDQRDRQGAQRRTDRRGSWRLQPQGWVTIAVDTDGDSRVDTSETIYYYDLQRARQASAQRKNDQRRQAQRRSDDSRYHAERPRADQRRQRRDARRGDPRQRMAPQHRHMMAEKKRRQNETRTIRGEISQLKAFRLADGPEHQFAKLETSDGKKVPVDLGRVEQIQGLDLQEGDDVQMLVRRGRYNDRPALIVDQIRANDQLVRVSKP